MRCKRNNASQFSVRFFFLSLLFLLLFFVFFLSLHHRAQWESIIESLHVHSTLITLSMWESPAVIFPVRLSDIGLSVRYWISFLTISPHPSHRNKGKKPFRFTHTNRSNSGDWAPALSPTSNSKREQWTGSSSLIVMKRKRKSGRE